MYKGDYTDERKTFWLGLVAVVAAGAVAGVIWFLPVEAKPKFVKGDCIDGKGWVTEERKLNGNQFRKVVGKTLDGGYLVQECQGKGMLTEGEGELTNIVCTKMLIEMPRHQIEQSAKIECPEGEY